MPKRPDHPPGSSRALLKASKPVSRLMLRSKVSRLPDIWLRCEQGSLVNPAAFAGHELVVLFCPTSDADAAREISSYLKHADSFVCRDAWVMIFADSPHTLAEQGHGMRILADPDRKAWVLFRDLTEDPEVLDRADGAVFYFARGGGLSRYWQGSGHVRRVLEELSVPACEPRAPLSNLQKDCD